jgi:histidinol phosphatase-like PHP family hydrolase
MGNNMNKESRIEVPGNWLQIDFHVHSPCSFDFQGIGKDESGYIWLLEQAKAAGLDVLIITDHNDIAGYFKLAEVENDLRRTIKTLERTSSEIPDSISNQISLFTDVAILPGVELDVYPNLHILVLFDPQRTDEISTFLTNAGYSVDVRGEENSSKFGKWNLDETLQEAEKIGAIVIAAHVDSDKGLYEASKKWGQSRISAFCNEHLYGMEFINPISRDQIENILKTPDYSRNSKLAFVQSSDFHGKPNQKIGERSTYVRVDDVEKSDKSNLFQAIKRALRNPDEFISAPGRPELQAILKRLDDKPSIESINSDDEKKLLNQFICAYSNTEDGTIVIGRNSKGNWTGQTDTSGKDFAEKIRSIINLNLTPPPLVNVQVYPYYGNNYVASLRIQKHPQICSLSSEDKIYILKSGKPKQASSKEIIDMAESRLIERYSHLSITNKLSEMSQKLMGTEDSIDILPIVRKIESTTIPLKMVLLPPTTGAIINDDNVSAIEMVGNGYTAGSIIALMTIKPRLNESYLRISAPIARYNPDSKKKFEDKYIFNGEKIVIAPGGGVYYDSSNDIAVACSNHPPLVFTKLNENYNLSLKFVAAYLKSSTAIWYAERCLGSHDIREIKVSRDLPIPSKVDSITLATAEQITDEILHLEAVFLDEEKKMLSEYSTKESRETEEFEEISRSLTEQHNEKAGQLIGKLDALFYNFFGLSSKEMDMIEQVMKSAGLAVLSEISLDE